MFITIAVIAYNEESTIGNILDDISKQDYNHSLIEVVLVDSASTDGTKTVMQEFARENKMGAGLLKVCVLTLWMQRHRGRIRCLLPRVLCLVQA